jgi:hypothetical protein
MKITFALLHIDIRRRKVTGIYKAYIHANLLRAEIREGFFSHYAICDKWWTHTDSFVCTPS